MTNSNDGGDGSTCAASSQNELSCASDDGIIVTVIAEDDDNSLHAASEYSRTEEDKLCSRSNSNASSRVGLDSMVEERRTQGHLVSNVVHIETRGTRRPIQTVHDGVHSGTVLGEGVAGLVRKVTHKATGLPFAVKVLNLNRLLARREQPHRDPASRSSDLNRCDFEELQQEALRNEITIMSQLDHPHIARLQEVYEDDDNIYLVQEVCEGGELFDLLEEQPNYHYNEQEALRLVWQMLSALRYLHAKGIVHRDLKLENFLFSTSKHLQLKMIGKWSHIFWNP